MPIRSGSAVVRLSQPNDPQRGVPDITAMALRVPVSGQVGRRWDILLAISSGPAQRDGVPLPAASWAGTRWSGLAPFRVGRAMVYLRAIALDERIPAGLSLDGLENDLSAGRSLHFAVEEASGIGRFRHVGDVTLIGRNPQRDIEFDETGTLPDGVGMFPGWLTAIR